MSSGKGLPAVTRTAGVVLGAEVSRLERPVPCLAAAACAADRSARTPRARAAVRARLRLGAREIRRRVSRLDTQSTETVRRRQGATEGRVEDEEAERSGTPRRRRCADRAWRCCAWLRSIPVVRKRVVPSLLKQELDQVPAAPIVTAMTRELERLRKSSGPILIGPWISEVGFEVLYWIPFLNWALKAFGLDERRLIVVSRGGARPWYQHLNTEYVDIFDLFTRGRISRAQRGALVTRGQPKAVRCHADGARDRGAREAEARSRRGRVAASIGHVQAASLLLVREGECAAADRAHGLSANDVGNRHPTS